MKIVTIFAEHLFSFHYKDEVDNEYDRLMNLWTDVKYLKYFAQQNNIKNISDFIENILDYAEDIQDLIEEIVMSDKRLETYFQPLTKSDYLTLILPKQKGKIKFNILRIYAIKIDENCFVITGGAIKMSQKMQDHPLTQIELDKLNYAKKYLNDNGVFDKESFFELKNEKND